MDKGSRGNSIRAHYYAVVAAILYSQLERLISVVVSRSEGVQNPVFSFSGMDQDGLRR
jgi:hypothetical protein